VAYAWMPEARRIGADIDGGPLRGGAPRAVWLALGTNPGTVSVQSIASRLISERRPCHLVWDPVTGEIGQLISVLRAGRALGATEGVGWTPEHVRTNAASVNADGRVCVQIGVLGHSVEPFTAGPMSGIDAIMSWLDSWYVPRRWPSGQPAGYIAPVSGDGGLGDTVLGSTALASTGLTSTGLTNTGLANTGRAAAGRAATGRVCGGLGTAGYGRSEVQWARGGHFGASQVPRCEHTGPGAIDVDRLTGPHGLQVRARNLPVSLSEPHAFAIPA
jgi:hypothetical protein